MSLYSKLFNNNSAVISDSNALVLGKNELTYGELNDKVSDLEVSFSQLGIKRNSKCIMLFINPYSFALCLLSLLKINAVPMPLYSKTNNNKITNIIEQYDTNYIISDHRLDKLESEGFIELKVDGYYIFALNDRICDELDDVSMILFTSGTTSMPKAIMLTETNVFSNILGISEYLALNNSDKVLLIKDLSHSSSIIGELLVGLFNGCTVILSDYLPSAKIITKMISKYSISVFFAVPTVLTGIIDLQSDKIAESCSTLRIINFYGSSIHHENNVKLRDLFPEVELFYSYGQTEASPRITYISTKDILSHPGSSGKAIKNVSFSIVNTDHKECKANEIGEIVVTGPNIMKGYYLNEEKTAKTVVNGKLYTGDLGYVDQNGFLYVTGRKDNMIIRAGKNIYPEEIEGVLSTHPDITSSLVISEEDTIIAYIILKNKKITKKELLDFCRKSLEIYKLPNIFYSVSEIEKTSSGKIMRKTPTDTSMRLIE